MLDRESYINFLEMQLEKVSAATLTVENFSPKFEALQLKVKSIEESIEKISSHLQQCPPQPPTSQSSSSFSTHHNNNHTTNLSGSHSVFQPNNSATPPPLTLKSMLQDKENERYLMRFLSRVQEERETVTETEELRQRIEKMEERMKESSDRIERDLRKLQKRVLERSKSPNNNNNNNRSRIHYDTPVDSSMNDDNYHHHHLHQEPTTTKLKKKKLHHHFHHYPDGEDGTFTEDKMQLIDGFDKLFHQVQSISESLDEVKRVQSRKNADTDVDIKKLRREIGKVHVSMDKTNDVNKEQLKNQNDRLLKLNKKMHSLSSMVQEVRDEQETSKETNDTQLMYRLTSIEKRMKSDSDEMIQMIRSIEREMQQQMYDMNSVMESELESLKDIRTEIVQHYSTKKSDAPDDREWSEMHLESKIDQLMSKRIRSIKQEMLSLLEEQQKITQEYIDSIVDNLHRTPPPGSSSTLIHRDKDKMSHGGATSSSRRKLPSTTERRLSSGSLILGGLTDVDREVYVTEPSLHSTPRNMSSSNQQQQQQQQSHHQSRNNTFHSMNNNNNNNGNPFNSRSGGDLNHRSSSPERRRRLKELYKELTDLEMQEFSSK